MSQPNNINDEKEHYKSLTELFKYSITLIMSLIVLFGGFASYTIYTNGKDMREDLKEEKKEMKVSIDEMKSDLKDQKEELNHKEETMKKTVFELMVSAKEEIDNTKQTATSQISNIRNIATDEARGRIDQVFKDKNFDQFVEKVAQERMEPRIQNLVDNKIDSIEKDKITKINSKIKDLFSTDKNKFLSAVEFLQYSLDQKLSDEQILRIITAIQQTSMDESLVPAMYHIFIYRKSPIIEKFFREDLLTGRNILGVTENELTYLMSSDYNQDITFYKNVLEKHLSNDDNIYDMFFKMLDCSITTNKKLTLQLLNSKPIVDLIYNSMKPEIQTTYRLNIMNKLRGTFAIDELISSYFFSKKM